MVGQPYVIIQQILQWILWVIKMIRLLHICQISIWDQSCHSYIEVASIHQQKINHFLWCVCLQVCRRRFRSAADKTFYSIKNHGEPSATSVWTSSAGEEVYSTYEQYSRITYTTYRRRTDDERYRFGRCWMLFCRLYYVVGQLLVFCWIPLLTLTGCKLISLDDEKRPSYWPYHCLPPHSIYLKFVSLTISINISTSPLNVIGVVTHDRYVCIRDVCFYSFMSF